MYFKFFKENFVRFYNMQSFVSTFENLRRHREGDKLEIYWRGLTFYTFPMVKLFSVHA